MTWGVTRKISRYVIKFGDETASSKDIEYFIELLKRLDPTIEEIIVE